MASKKQSVSATHADPPAVAEEASQKATSAPSGQPVPTDSAPSATAPNVSSKINAFLESDIAKELKKRHGRESVVIASTRLDRVTPRYSSQIFALDAALGGGWARGRLNLIFGPKHSGKTFLLMRALSVVQRLCERCNTLYGDEVDHSCRCKNFSPGLVALVDVEGNLDRAWTERHSHLNFDGLIYSRCETGEEALEVVEGLLASRTVAAIGVDSVAFLEPKVELAGNVGDVHVAPQARLMGSAVRRLTSMLNSYFKDKVAPPTLFFTNQIRYKTGVVFGCFHGDTPVTFADGTQHTIRSVVRKKLAGPVLSWNGSEVVERKIVNWYANGQLQEGQRWLTFQVAGSGGRRGSMGFTCTGNHTLVTAQGEEIAAQNVKVGAQLLSWYEARLTEVETQVVIGSLLGDGQVTRSGSFSLANQEQPEYLAWKKNLFSSVGFARITGGGRVSWTTESTHEFRLIRKMFYTGTAGTAGKKCYRTIPLDLVRSLSPLALAVWYMDDGTYRPTHRNASISVKRLSSEDGVRVAEVLNLRFPGTTYRTCQRAICFTVPAFALLSQEIAEYVPECMRYKLLPEHRELPMRAVVKQAPVVQRRCCAVEVQSISYSKRKHRQKQRFDLQIEGNSYYLVGGDSRGVVVHNSPEVMPGGQALQFFSSIEVRCSPGKYKTDEKSTLPRYGDFDFRVDKNKTFVSRGEGTYRLCLSAEEGKPRGAIIDEDQLLDWSLQLGVMLKENNTIIFGDKRWKNQTVFLAELAHDRKLRKEVEACLMPKILDV